MSDMYDSTNANAIPVTAAIVMGYPPSGVPSLDAGIAWSDADWARFPNARKVRIARFAFMDVGDGLDVENFDATPAQAPGWIRMRQAAGLAVPFIYCNLSNIDAVRAACQGLTYDLGVAHYDGRAVLDDPSWAFKQYANSAITGQDYDLSITAPWWPRGGTFMGLTDQQQQDLYTTVMNSGGVLAKLDGRVLGDLPASGGAGWGTVSATVMQDDASLAQISAQNQAAKAELDALKAEVEAGGSVDAAAAIARIEAALKGA